MSDVDAYFCAGDAPGFGGFSMAEYLGLQLSHIDTTETGGSSYLCHVGHATAAIAAGKCSVALVTLAGLPRSDPASMMGGARAMFASAPEAGFEMTYGMAITGGYRSAARSVGTEYGHTSKNR